MLGLPIRVPFTFFCLVGNEMAINVWIFSPVVQLDHITEIDNVGPAAFSSNPNLTRADQVYTQVRLLSGLVLNSALQDRRHLPLSYNIEFFIDHLSFLDIKCKVFIKTFCTSQEKGLNFTGIIKQLFCQVFDLLVCGCSEYSRMWS